MYTSEHIAIVAINALCIGILTVMTFVLLIAVRGKKASGYAALIIMLTNVPVYLYNSTRSIGLFSVAQYFFPLATIFNVMLMPLLFLHAKKTLNYNFPSPANIWLHFIPAVFSGILTIGYFYFFLSAEGRRNFMINEINGSDHWTMMINSLMVIVQGFVYFFLIFRLFKQTRTRIQNKYSEIELCHIQWLFKFNIMLFSVFIIFAIAYSINPRTDVWLLPILSTIAMVYLVYNSIKNPIPEVQFENDLIKPEMEISNKAVPDMIQMNDYVKKIISFLNESQSYTNPDLTLNGLSRATSISEKNISKSINTILNKNFFELINRLRIEKAKTKLTSEYLSHNTIESIAKECGFHSRSAFYSAFKKFEGTTPTAIIKQKNVLKPCIKTKEHLVF
ncbi:MAG: helix-turn-helix domain-containing protein [Bacteroidota bacterium]|nr:helix-turn-helix domain-containing protein [Bacteroidota bacterium]